MLKTAILDLNEIHQSHYGCDTHKNYPASVKIHEVLLSKHIVKGQDMPPLVVLLSGGKF